MKKINRNYLQLFAFFILFYFVLLIAYNRTGPFSRNASPNPAYEPPPLRSPWENVPNFILYLRFTASARFEAEYRDSVVRTMRVFFPAERSSLLVVLDKESQTDQELGQKLEKEWPYPEICYSDPGNATVYLNQGKTRMFWDMMHPDLCTDAPYVGFIDTDTFFTTLVTPNLLFENGLPIIVAKIGRPDIYCWEEVTEIFLGKKEALQCMSTFPVMIKTSHMKEMREVLSKEQGKKFDDIFMHAVTGRPVTCFCQFSIMCNYVWYYHREEYSWHLQMVIDGDWNGLNWVPSMVPVDYYKTEVKPWMKIPIPRSSIHLRYSIVNGVYLIGKAPEKNVIDDHIREGLCYSAGFDYCPEQCKRWDRKKIHFNLYSFECYQWFWDKRCLPEQEKHYLNVQDFVNYSISNQKEIFGLASIDYLCPWIANVSEIALQ